MSDLRYAFRQLAKSPGFTLVAVLTLALGIGSATAMFSGLRAIVLEPFSYPQADRLVHVWSKKHNAFSSSNFLDLSERSTSFAELGTYFASWSNFGGEKPQAVMAAACTPGVLRAFGTAPALGRWFEPTDEATRAPPVAILSHHLWQTALGGDLAVIGRSIRFNGRDVTVIGVMPANFEFSSPWWKNQTFDLWVPLQLERQEAYRQNGWLCVIGRLKPGLSFAAADAEVKAVAAQLTAAYPITNSNTTFTLSSLRGEMLQGVGSQTWMLFGAVVMLLWVACINVAGMLLARGAQRQNELGVRIALGATRRQIIRLAVAEAALLALAGAAGGIVFADSGVRLLALVTPLSDVRRTAMTLDGSALGFALGLTFFAVLCAGLPPALAATRISTTDLLRTDSRTATASRTRHRLLRGLIMAQVAIAFVLVTGAALLFASYLKLQQANRSLATDQVLSAQLNLYGERYQKNEARTQFWEQLAVRLETLPGVTAAGLTARLPLNGGSNMSVLINDEHFVPGVSRPMIEVSSVTPRYFAAAGIMLRQGRTLEPADAAGEVIGVVINRAFAEKSWPGENPLGKIIRADAEKPWFTTRVVGVVEDSRQSPTEEPRPQLYWSPNRAWGQSVHLVIRSSGSATSLIPAVRREVAALDPDLSLARVRSFQDVLDAATRGQRSLAWLGNFFMVASLGLVVIGIYGTLSYYVAQRTREIGVRMAMGASQGSVIRLIFRQAFNWVLIGSTIGLAGAIALTFWLRSLIYRVNTLDPLALLTSALAITVATGLACWLPARRATQVDPMTALRAE